MDPLLRNLVIIAAGSNSLHKSWCKCKKRNFDIFTVDFTENNDLKGIFGDFYLSQKGPKWSLMHSAIMQLGDEINNYKAVWFPDDDILVSAESINDMFDFFHKTGLDIAQPGLSRDSYFSHFITFSIPGVAYRRTNFVEIMVPILKTDILHEDMPYMERMKSGWGLDFLWMKHSNQKHLKIGILDKVQVKHTRPINSPIRGGVKSEGMYKGLLPWDELDDFSEIHDITDFKTKTEIPFLALNIKMPLSIFKFLTELHRFLNRKHIRYQNSLTKNS